MNNKITYNKLIRDNIPKIIELNGKHSKTYVASKEDYKNHLLLKLIEEATEMQEMPCLEELADIMEVIESIKTIYDFKDNELNKVKEEKKIKKGGFEDRIILEYVYED